MKKIQTTTKISEARNLGPRTEQELNAIGVMSLEDVKKLGWEEVCFRYISSYPGRLNLNLVYAMIGAVKDQDWRGLSLKDKETAKNFVAALRNSQ